MRDRLLGLFEEADLAIASCAGEVDSSLIEPLIDLVSAGRARLSYPEDVLVVALAGGTGSGKSSLFNAMSGAELVDVGGIRPTTSEPAVMVPVAIGATMDGYLDRLGIEERHSFEGSAVCVIDLPDTDSIEVEHRHRVDRVLPMVDVVVWVTDPEKYRDARLHADYLQPLSDYGGQFVFVLNQVDRLDVDGVDRVVADLYGAIEEDGIVRPRVIPLSANPSAGPPVGLDQLEATLRALRSDPATLYRKLLVDIAVAAHTLEVEAGGAMGFDRLAEETVTLASSAVVNGDVGAASRQLVDFLDTVAAWVGGEVRQKIEMIAADTPSHLERISAEVRPKPVPRRWYQRKTEELLPDPNLTSDLINQALIRPVRALLAKRALAVASVARLGLEVQSLSRETPR